MKQKIVENYRMTRFVISTVHQIFRQLNQGGDDCGVYRENEICKP
jgi:hypothetical protein